MVGNSWLFVVGFDYFLLGADLSIRKFHMVETGFCKQVELHVQVFEAKSKEHRKVFVDIKFNMKLKLDWWRRGRLSLPLKRG